MARESVHHIGHPYRDGMTCCGVPMPREQFAIRPRGMVEICGECSERFKRFRRSGNTSVTFEE